jgi:uncharacterized protein (TIGR03435 family)
MIFPAFLNGIWTAALVNHLWQSTIVTIMAWLLALMLRNNHARARYWVWMIASVKYLVPFSLLIAAGGALRPAMPTPIQTPQLDAVMAQITQPYTQTAVQAAAPAVSAAPAAVEHSMHLPPWILPAVWLCGVLALALTWVRKWQRLRRTVRDAEPMTLLAEVPVLSSASLLEPGVFGIVRPVLLLPKGITERLSAAQLGTIVAHEMNHVRRRDNLTAAIHMVVETLFWFHPAVWWIKSRLLEERERACDEAVLQSGNKADLYAESILNVCKFYVESPLACVSGVTGSDLKRRIVRIMEEQVVNKLDLGRKLLLGLAATIAVAVPITFGLVHVNQVSAQTANLAQDLSGTWQGTLHVGKDLRLVAKISKTDSGAYKGVLYSIDQGGGSLPANTTTLQESTVKIAITGIGAKFEGKLSGDGKTIEGNWSQGPNPLPLTLTRATPETEWTIPEPPPVIPPMAANANPSFEVATIKPSKPDAPGKGFIVDGRRFKTINTTLGDLISFTYGIHPKQLVGAPAWVDSEKFDITAQPDGEGTPSQQQWKTMWQKLLAERFKLAFHHDKKELSVYVLSVGKSGPKLTKSEGDPNGLPGLFFRQFGALSGRNATMSEFSSMILQNAVLDRPVLDQTGITGRWDFTLNWTPDDSQFASFGVKIPPPTDAANAPPNLYTAIQEQLGLKLEATKAPADVLVVDHVEKPSEN